MNVLVRLGWRDLCRNRRFSLLFIVNLALGLTGFMVIGSFSGSLNHHLEGNLREILTADLVLQSSRPLTVQEIATSREITGPDSRYSEQISFYSMVKGGTVAKLAQIVAIDSAYPLYGAFRIPEAGSPAQVINSLQQAQKLLMSRETARSLDLRQGDTLHIGKAAYEVAYFFDQEPSSELSALVLAPKIYLGVPQLHNSGLIRFGSRIAYKHFIRLPDSADAAQVFTRLKRSFTENPEKTSDIRVANTRDVNRRLGRVVTYFSTFLGLVGMVSLFLSGLTAAFLFREQLQARLKETAILLSLGASQRQCLALSAGQLSLLGLVAACVAIVLAWLLLPLFGRLFTGIIPPHLHLTVAPTTAILTLLVGAIGSLLFCLPVYLRIFTVRPLSLLQEDVGKGTTSGTGSLLLFATTLPALAMFALLATILSRSQWQGGMFTAGLFALVATFSLIAGLLLIGCRRWSQTSSLTWRIVWRNLYRNRLSATAVFVALATSLLLVNLIPQIQQGLMEEIGQPEGIELPVYFLVDIQQEQQQPLRSFFQGTGPVLSPLAPMVQGRIVTVNSMPFSQWRREHQGAENDAFRRTEYNFSSREQLEASEYVVQGPPMSTMPWLGKPGQPFEISMEQQFSQRLGVTIGDRLLVDIQGMEIEGRIVNLRKVRWNSFQPNFFLLLQQGVLDDAPKTYLASVSRIAPEEKQEVLNRLAGAFPNISVIDVTGMVAQLGDIAGKLTGSLRFMAWLAMATGLIAVISIARQEALRREREVNLLRVLGAGIGRIRILVTLEFGFLGATAAFTAVLFSYAGAYAVAWLLFDRIWHLQWQSGISLLVATPLICALIALFAADTVIRRKPTVLLG